MMILIIAEDSLFLILFTVFVIYEDVWLAEIPLSE